MKEINIFSLQTEGICPPFWDNASCIPPALSGQTATLPCMTMFAGKLYDTTGEPHVTVLPSPLSSVNKNRKIYKKKKLA